MKVDCHCHYYPPEYLKRLENGVGAVSMGRDAIGRKVIRSGGVPIATITPAMSDLDLKLSDMDGAGVDIQVLSLTTPNVYFGAPRDCIELARLVNESLAEAVDGRPDRFVGLASLPMLSPQEAPAELIRAVEKLGLKGAVVLSNVAGRPLDSPEFYPVLETAAGLGVPILIHPTAGPGAEEMREFRLVPLVGFEFDLTLAAARLAFSGILERLPNLKIVISHLGGALPYLFERLDNGYRAYPECRERISELPSTYLKRLYYDTVSFHQPALTCAYQSVGASQLVMGSDHPHVIGDLKRAVTTIAGMPLSEAEKEQIFANGARLFLHDK